MVSDARVVVERHTFGVSGKLRYPINPLARVVRVGNPTWTYERLRDVGAVRMRDTQGRDVPHDIPFAFAFHAFYPDGIWMLGN